MSCFAKKLTQLVFPFNTFIQYHHQRKRLFADIYDYDNIKKLFKMVLDIILRHAPDTLSRYPSIVKREGPEGRILFNFVSVISLHTRLRY
jgi:hypothetical protein